MWVGQHCPALLQVVNVLAKNFHLLLFLNTSVVLRNERRKTHSHSSYLLPCHLVTVVHSVAHLFATALSVVGCGMATSEQCFFGVVENIRYSLLLLSNTRCTLVRTDTAMACVFHEKLFNFLSIQTCCCCCT